MEDFWIKLLIHVPIWIVIELNIEVNAWKGNDTCIIQKLLYVISLPCPPQIKYVSKHGIWRLTAAVKQYVADIIECSELYFLNV